MKRPFKQFQHRPNIFFQYCRERRTRSWFLKEISLLAGLTFRYVSQHHQSMNKLNEYRIYNVRDIKLGVILWRCCETLRNVSPVNKLISFINHGFITCTLPGINISPNILKCACLCLTNIERSLQTIPTLFKIFQSQQNEVTLKQSLNDPKCPNMVVSSNMLQRDFGYRNTRRKPKSVNKNYCQSLTIHVYCCNRVGYLSREIFINISYCDVACKVTKL